jgi:helicase
MGVDSIMLIEELEKYGVSKNYIDLLKFRDISDLNPIQSEAVEKGVFSRVHMVVSAPTASGKALMAEMALVKECLINSSRYFSRLSPKSLFDSH